MPAVTTNRDLGWLRAPYHVAPVRRYENPELKKCHFFPARGAREDVLAGVERMRLEAVDLARREAANDTLPPATAAASPLLVGVMLAVLPPAGLALLWASPAYSREARYAITTMMGVFALCATALLLLY